MIDTQQSLERLAGVLTRYDGIRVSSKVIDPDNEKVSIYFDYKERQLSVVEKVEFINQLARILGSSDDYSAYEASISMIWIGEKGVGGMNEPFFELETFVWSMESLMDILNTALNMRVTPFPAFTANHPPENRNISSARCKIAEKVMSFFEDIIARSILVSWVTALAKTTRTCKDRIFYLFAKCFPFHRRKSNTINGECQY
jgi:hypothetical protein